MVITSESVSINGTTYTVVWELMSFQNGLLTVDVTLIREGSSAIITNSETRLLINGNVVDTSTADPFTGGNTITLNGMASNGDTITIEWVDEDFGSHIELQGTVQSDDDGGPPVEEGSPLPILGLAGAAAVAGVAVSRSKNKKDN